MRRSRLPATLLLIACGSRQQVVRGSSGADELPPGLLRLLDDKNATTTTATTTPDDGRLIDVFPTLCARDAAPAAFAGCVSVRLAGGWPAAPQQIQLLRDVTVIAAPPPPGASSPSATGGGGGEPTLVTNEARYSTLGGRHHCANAHWGETDFPPPPVDFTLADAFGTAAAGAAPPPPPGAAAADDAPLLLIGALRNEKSFYHLLMDGLFPLWLSSHVLRACVRHTRARAAPGRASESRDRTARAVAGASQMLWRRWS
jgi:hypothetical protein